MEWKGRRRSTNVKYSKSTGKKVAGGSIITVVIAGIVMLLSGGDLSSILGLLQSGALSGGGTQMEMVDDSSTEGLSAKEIELREYVETILAETEDVWAEEFRKLGKVYRAPEMHVFKSAVQSACGGASSATGPFYCSADETVYLDLSFFDELNAKYAKGDFPLAYVIAHEVGHHVQHLLGTLEQVHAYRKSGQKIYNQMTVRLELQADFYAGLWANKSKYNLNLTNADINEALTAASAIGDDRLQMQAQGYVVPDSFTHGTSEQRSRWFKKGYTTGDIRQGDSFSGSYEGL